jgi:hypothetical protein
MLCYKKRSARVHLLRLKTCFTMQRLEGELVVDIVGIVGHSVTVSIHRWIHFVLRVGVF